MGSTDNNDNRVFLYFLFFLPNAGRILAALTFNGCDPLYVNAGRILPGFGRKLRNIGKLECLILSLSSGVNSNVDNNATHF